MALKRKRPIKSEEDIEDLAMTVDRPLRRHLLQFEVIKKWRVGRVADVDVFGCYKLAEAGVDERVKE